MLAAISDGYTVDALVEKIQTIHTLDAKTEAKIRTELEGLGG